MSTRIFLHALILCCFLSSGLPHILVHAAYDDEALQQQECSFMVGWPFNCRKSKRWSRSLSSTDPLLSSSWLPVLPHEVFASNRRTLSPPPAPIGSQPRGFFRLPSPPPPPQYESSPSTGSPPPPVSPQSGYHYSSPPLPPNPPPASYGQEPTESHQTPVPPAAYQSPPVLPPVSPPPALPY